MPFIKMFPLHTFLQMPQKICVEMDDSKFVPVGQSPEA